MNLEIIKKYIQLERHQIIYSPTSKTDDTYLQQFLIQKQYIIKCTKHVQTLGNSFTLILLFMVGNLIGVFLKFCIFETVVKDRRNFRLIS